MRILLFPSAYAPAVGGVEEWTSRLAAHLRAGGDVVEVWTHRHPSTLPVRDVIDETRVERFSLPLPSMTVRGIGRFAVDGPLTLLRILRAARRFRPDVVHVQCFSANGAYATVLSAITGAPMVITLQGETVMDDADIYDHSVSLRVALRIALRRATAVTACSRFVLDDAQRFGLPAGSGTVVPNGVDLDGDLAPVSLTLPSGRYVFAVGRMVEKKGFDLLLRAFALTAIEHPAVNLVIGGSGNARPGLEGLIKELDLTARVVLTGVLSRDEVTWAMRHADVFVLPSRIEPFGIVVLEALREGRATIVSSRGGAGEIVSAGVNGLIADPYDTVELARAISALLADDHLRTRLGGNGVARARTFSWETISARYQEIYRYVVNKSDPSAGPAI